MFKTQQEIQANYENLLADAKIKVTRVKAKIDRLSFIRVALLVADIALFISFVSANDDVVTFILGLCLLIPIGIFIVVVKKQDVLSKHESYLKNLVWVYQNEVNLGLGLENGYDHGGAFDDENHPYL